MPHKNPDDRRAFMRKYKKLHPEKFGQDYDRVCHANSRARSLGIPGRITIADVRAIKASGKCFYCGAKESRGKVKDLGIDHQIPLSSGGPNDPSNIVCCCHNCNSSKFRSDRPGRWSRAVESCRKCGGTERKHEGNGHCTRCYQAIKKELSLVPPSQPA